MYGKKLISYFIFTETQINSFRSITIKEYGKDGFGGVFTNLVTDMKMILLKIIMQDAQIGTRISKLFAALFIVLEIPT